MATKPFPFEVCKECCAGGGGGGDIILDTEMSDTSESAVQNKVIKAYVDNSVKPINEAIDSGELKGEKGDKGDPYILTESDKEEIVTEVLASIHDGDGVKY